MIRDVFVRSAYNYDPDLVSDDTGLHCMDESLTVQSQQNDADINTIVKRFGLTGQVPSVAMPPSYGDFDTVSDYRSAIELVRAADDSFMKLPADVRYRFGNDPAAFVDFASDPANLAELRKMGLAVPQEKLDVQAETEVRKDAGAGGKDVGGSGSGNVS